MQKRSIPMILILTIVTLGIYSLIWEIKTANEMKAKGADIPHWILIFIPLVNIYWLWMYSEGVAKITNNKYSGALVFLLFFLTGIGGMIISQLAFNEVTASTAAPAAFNNAVAPVAPTFAAAAPEQPAPESVAPSEPVTPTVEPTQPVAEVSPEQPQDPNAPQPPQQV